MGSQRKSNLRDGLVWPSSRASPLAQGVMDMTNVYVGNLPFSITDSKLQELFAEYGTVHMARVVIDRATGRSRGFGFVEMADAPQSQAAIAALNGSQLGDRTLTVNEARPRS